MRIYNPNDESFPNIKDLSAMVMSIQPAKTVQAAKYFIHQNKELVTTRTWKAKTEAMRKSCTKLWVTIQSARKLIISTISLTSMMTVMRNAQTNQIQK